MNYNALWCRIWKAHKFVITQECITFQTITLKQMICKISQLKCAMCKPDTQPKDISWIGETACKSILTSVTKLAIDSYTQFWQRIGFTTDKFIQNFSTLSVQVQIQYKIRPNLEYVCIVNIPQTNELFCCWDNIA